MSEDYKAQASYRFGTNGQSMLNLRGDSVAELHVLTVEAVDGKFIPDLIVLDQTLQAGATLAQGGVAFQPPANTTPVPTPIQAAPSYRPPKPQDATVPVCPHGARVFKRGESARGPWAAWMCPAPKDTPGKCTPDWVRD